MHAHLVHRSSRPRTRRQHFSGTVAVEFAVILPIVFLLFLGCLELTAINFARQTAGNASYEAARKMIIPGGTSADAVAEGLRHMKNQGMGTGATVTTSQDQTSVTATVSVPASSVSWGLIRFTGGISLRQSCTLTKE